jgi:hypothetical protein
LRPQAQQNPRPLLASVLRPIAQQGTELAAHGIRFDLAAQNQRGALALLNGHIFVPFGGHFGNCSDYHGGIGMFGIAEILHNLGYAVQGSDIAGSANVPPDKDGEPPGQMWAGGSYIRQLVLLADDRGLIDAV